jgi:hypothetical protein
MPMQKNPHLIYLLESSATIVFDEYIVSYVQLVVLKAIGEE